MWEMFAAAGIQGWLGNQGKGEIAAINNRLSQVTADATNQVKRGRNIEEMARNGLSRYVQSINNNRTLDDGGDAFTANLINGLHNQDNEVNKKLLGDVRTLEEFGAAMASQGASGAGGQVTDMINSTTALRASISKELALQSGESMDYAIIQRGKSIMSQMVGGLDGSLIIDQIDTGQAFAQKQYAMSDGQAMFNSVLTTAIKAGVGNVAEWGSQQLGKLGKDTGMWGDSAPKYGSLTSGSGGAAKFGWSLRPQESYRIGT